MSYTAKVLLVEDDREIVENLTEYLSTEGYLVKSVNTQKDTMEILEKETFDLLLLDVTLKQGNGYGVCTAVKEKYDLPVIFLTALDDEFSVVTGLDMGADDYISKPFRPRELVSRMRSVLRRSGRTQAVVNIRDIRIDTEKGIVTRAGQELFLSALEYRLLLVFVNNRGMVLTRGRLLDEIWDAAGEFVNDNTLTVAVKRLREKLGHPACFRTVRSFGYRMEM